jgi:serine/threonine protein kinase
MSFTEEQVNLFNTPQRKWERRPVDTKKEPSGSEWFDSESNQKIKLGSYEIARDLMKSDERAKRFSLVSEIKHPSIVKCIDFKVIQTSLLVAYNDFEGINLSTFLANHGKIDEQTVEKIILQVLSAVECLHAKNLVHGRLLLENIIYKPLSGEARVVGVLHLDEGTAWGATARLNERYFPPELILFQEYTLRSEVYILGLMILELLNGVRWLEHIDDSKVIGYCTSKEFRIPKVVPERTSERLRNILERSLFLDPEKRFSTVGEMRIAFWGKEVTSTQLLRYEDGAFKGKKAESCSFSEDNGQSPEMASSLRLEIIRQSTSRIVKPFAIVLSVLLILWLFIFVLNNFELGTPDKDDIKAVVLEASYTASHIRKLADTW